VHNKRRDMYHLKSFEVKNNGDGLFSDNRRLSLFKTIQDRRIIFALIYILFRNCHLSSCHVQVCRIWLDLTIRRIVLRVEARFNAAQSETDIGPSLHHQHSIVDRTQISEVDPDSTKTRDSDSQSSTRTSR
jgi:hypothetical protein